MLLASCQHVTSVSLLISRCGWTTSALVLKCVGSPWFVDWDTDWTWAFMARAAPRPPWQKWLLWSVLTFSRNDRTMPGLRATVHVHVQYLWGQLGRGAQPQVSGHGPRLKELTKKLVTRNSPFTVTQTRYLEELIVNFYPSKYQTLQGKTLH